MCIFKCMFRQEDKRSPNEDIVDEFERLAPERLNLVYELDLMSKRAKIIHQQYHKARESPSKES